MTSLRPLLVVSACLLATAAGATDDAPGSQLGQIDFPTSGATAAQPAFVRGVLLLHSFEFEDAREAFREAQAADPGFALAVWGEAMTHNHPLWREVDLEAGREALARLAPTAEARLAKAGSELERGLMAAVELLFGDGDKSERDRAYCDAMARLHRRFPDDLEVAAFYSLAILGTANGERDFATYMRAAAVAEEVFARNPRHPGAAHYLIHSYDDPIHAPLGLRAARVYAKIAPAATHAQHMISHIYTALGWWDEAVRADETALAVSEERLRRKGQPLHKRTHHSLHWLTYSYLQQGRIAAARENLSMIDADVAADPTVGSRWYQAAMHAGVATETGDWSVAARPLDLAGVDLSAVAADCWAKANLALAAADAAGAREALDRLEARREAAAADTSASSRGAARVVELQIRGAMARAMGDLAAAIELLEQAAQAEEGMPLDFGPPAIVKPSHEMLGELLLAAGRPEEARRRFAQALARTPRRAAALRGLAEAARGSGDVEGATAAEEELAAVRRHADPAVVGG